VAGPKPYVERVAESEYVAECFWPGVREDDLSALDERVAGVVAGLSENGEPIRYLGSILMRGDEVVLCLFEGSEPMVRLAAAQAEVPFERILEAARSPWRPAAH
jgi:hypothetical protein